MRNLKYLVVLLLFTSCVTQKKVKNWLDDHPTEAAGYCADKFPPDTVTRVITSKPDSTGYNDANDRMQRYADSLFYRLDSLQHAPRTEADPCPPRVNLDSLRKEVDREIRRRLTPCVDSIVYITNTVIDKARETQLRGLNEEKDKTISARDKRITDLEAKVKAKSKWIWMFWILVAILGISIFLKVKKILPFVLVVALFVSCIEERRQDPAERETPEERDTIPYRPPADTATIITH